MLTGVFFSSCSQKIYEVGLEQGQKKINSYKQQINNILLMSTIQSQTITLQHSLIMFTSPNKLNLEQNAKWTKEQEQKTC